MVMVSTGRAVLPGGDSGASAVVVTDGLGAVFRGSTDVEVLRACGVFYTHAGRVRSAVGIGFTAHGAVALWDVAPRAHVGVESDTVGIGFTGVADP